MDTCWKHRPGQRINHRGEVIMEDAFSLSGAFSDDQCELLHLNFVGASEEVNDRFTLDLYQTLDAISQV